MMKVCTIFETKSTERLVIGASSEDKEYGLNRNEHTTHSFSYVCKRRRIDNIGGLALRWWEQRNLGRVDAWR